MTRPAPPPRRFTEDTIRRRVNDIMKRAIHQLDHPGETPTFPEFKDLLDALMKANNKLSPTETAENFNRLMQADITRKKRKAWTRETIGLYQEGNGNPPYRFIEDLVDSNIFLMDDARLQPGGDVRAAVFAMAGLTEVTSQSILTHYKKTVKKAKEALDRSEELHWATVIKDLFAIHVQGELSSMTRIQEELHHDNPELFTKRERLNNLMQLTAQPTDAERQLIYAYLDLPAENSAWLEREYGEQGRLSKKTRPIQETPFSRTLNDMLTILEENGINQSDLERDTRSRSGPALIRSNEFGQWRRGEVSITPPKLRTLVRILGAHIPSKAPPKSDRDPVMALAILKGEAKAPPALKRHITQEQIETLITTAGFSRELLYEGARTILETSPKKSTDIKSLLKRMREAPDVQLTIKELAEGQQFAGRSMKVAIHNINTWENPRLAYPTPAQAREIAERIDWQLKDNALSGFIEADLKKIEAIAEAAHKKWTKIPPAKKHAAYKATPRPMVTSWRETVRNSGTAAVTFP